MRSLPSAQGHLLLLSPGCLSAKRREPMTAPVCMRHPKAGTTVLCDIPQRYS